MSVQSILEVSSGIRRTAVLVAVVRFGTGVVLSLLTTESFDPRLVWAAAKACRLRHGGLR